MIIYIRIACIRKLTSTCFVVNTFVDNLAQSSVNLYQSQFRSFEAYYIISVPSSYNGFPTNDFPTL